MVEKEKAKMGVIVVDFQADFTESKKGSLAVEGTDEAFIKKVEENTKKLKEAGYPIFGTLDWHPANHISFFTSHEGKKAFEVIKIRGKDQVLWPPHCVQNTPGAEVLLDKRLFKAFVKTATDPQYEGYSGFQDDGGKKTELDQLLKTDQINRVVVYGIATDYCVRATALDALTAGYQVVLIKNLCRGVAPDTSQKALEEMKTKGVVILDDLDLEKLTGD
ncbi:MAG TPA: isochorismatase family protein [Thermodesulfobacteriota bacterium]|nr:isochorismatase family protein [Thermodesulfobacteriota bacterium]